MTSYHDTPVYADVEAEARADWLAERPDGYDPGDQEAGEGPMKPLGPDPWLPWRCSGCGDVCQDGAPEVCAACGFRNYGRTA